MTRPSRGGNRLPRTSPAVHQHRSRRGRAGARPPPPASRQCHIASAPCSLIEAGRDKRTHLRFSRISIARCADLVRSSASAWVLCHDQVHPVIAAPAHGPRSHPDGTFGSAGAGPRLAARLHHSQTEYQTPSGGGECPLLPRSADAAPADTHLPAGRMRAADRRPWPR
jgi:hypothetical protein